jgi:hypothetical protein
MPGSRRTIQPVDQEVFMAGNMVNHRGEFAPCPGFERESGSLPVPAAQNFVEIFQTHHARGISRVLFKIFQRQDNQLVNVRAGGNCASILFIDLRLVICEFKTLRQSRSRQALHENASHGSAIGEHGTFPATRFCLAFTSLTIPEK